ncbi:MAG: hypothetical protein QOF51_1566, partial [Chloroflexota bacterium]|nr:hypothetical protein [Chloroflexota bacterium]
MWRGAVRLEELVASYQAQRQELDRQGVYFLGTITEEEAERFSKTLFLMAS